MPHVVARAGRCPVFAWRARPVPFDSAGRIFRTLIPIYREKKSIFCKYRGRIKIEKKILKIVKIYSFNDCKMFIKIRSFSIGLRERERGGNVQKGGKKERERIFPFTIVPINNDERVLIHGNESYASPRSNPATIRSCNRPVHVARL